MTTGNPSTINLGHTEVILRSDTIIQVNDTDHCYSMADIKEIHHSFHEISGGKKALVLLIASEFTTVDTNARHFLSTPEAGVHSIAEAYVIKSLAQRMLLNFLFSVQGTPTPAKFFTDIDLAIKWLKKFQSEK